ncbi:integrin beta-1-A-like [Corticium candelabrum]|uniref:integrin beta-1-A-like n=1 Tax=Corticium candelabrum TaxID=121492 RepID=UPI002E25D2A2|nr:integrin beta-1-A-like [Corticium candelabrum]
MASSGVSSIHKIGGKLNSTGYQEILANKKLPDAYILIGEDFILQQDNAPIHIAFSMGKCLCAKDVTVLEWPSRSPNANPIEHLWHWLKVKAVKNTMKCATELANAVRKRTKVSSCVEFVLTKVDASESINFLLCQTPIKPYQLCFRHYERDNSVNDEFSKNNQIRPQEVKLLLRKGQSEKIEVTVKRAADYPVDLYYLMDVSNSMKDDLEKLKGLAKNLTATLGNLTNDYQVGFGKFVDKVTLPFVDTYGPRLDDPCNDNCEPAFSFINSLPLNSDEAVFEEGILKEKTSGNLDRPEGLLDALMQTSVCTEAIRWRRDAWHLVVMATDDQYHTAGDGKLGGIYTPNDGKCHLDHNNRGGKYTNATEWDYPSVSQMRKVLFDNKIIPMFAVVNDVQPLYQALRNALLPVRGFIGELDKDSSNILELIRRGYEEIASEVFLTAANIPDAVRADIKVVKCVGKNATAVESSDSHGCTGIKESEKAVFEVTLELLECVSDSLNVYIDAGAFGRTQVTIEPLCSCSCEVPASTEENSDKCSGHGKLQCGICICYGNRAGEICDKECDPTDNAATIGCKPTNSTAATPGCSGHGRCVCDECICDVDDKGRPLYAGKYCQCPQLYCARDKQGKECGGEEQGVCVCDRPDCKCECQCKSGWKNTIFNPTCECSTDTSGCMESGELCSKHGTCDCDGQCECNEGFYGIYCQTCVSCPDVCRLDGLEECVACSKSQGGCVNSNCSSFILHETLRSEPKDDYRIISTEGPENTVRCELKNADNCIYVFYITEREIDGARIVEALADGLEDCPTPVDVVPIVAGIVGGIFAIGLALLFIWWILMQIAAFREYKAFVKEQANASWNQTTSPLYEPPSQKYLNPTYKGKSQKSQN